MTRYPLLALICGLTLIVATGIGAFYSLLAIGVSAGAGLVTGRIMLGCCVAAFLGALVLSVRSAAVLLARL